MGSVREKKVHRERNDFEFPHGKQPNFPENRKVTNSINIYRIVTYTTRLKPLKLPLENRKRFAYIFSNYESNFVLLTGHG